MMATVRVNQFGEIKLDKEYYRRLGESGIRIFFLICDTEWLIPDGFTKFCEEAEALLDVVPDAYIIPRIGLHPPVDWIKNHPDDCVRANDLKDRPVRLITESYTADLPNMYSLCSDNWRKDAGKALEKGHIYGQLDKPFRMNARPYQEHDTPSYLYPLIYADDYSATVLGHFCNTKLPAFVIKDSGDFTSVFCGTKLIQAEVIRNIARFTGCHVYTEGNDVLYANRNFITIHAARAGIKHIKLRECCYPYEMYEDRFYETGNEITLEMAEGETKMFALLKENKKPDILD